MMKNKFLIVLSFLLVSCSSVETLERKEQEKQNKFIDFEIVQISQTGESTDLKLVVKIPINKLVFEKKINYFESIITLDILVNDSNNKIIFSKSWNEKVAKNYYEDTKTSEKIFLYHELTLNIGEYKINLIINDFKNHINWVKKTSFSVKEQHGLSDISILYKEDDIYKNYKEDINVNDLDSLWVGFQINDPNMSEVKCFYEFINVDFDDEYIIKDSKNNEFDIILFKEENNNSSLNIVVFEKEVIIKKINDEQMSFVPIPIINDYFNMLKINLDYNGEIRYKVLNFSNQLEYQYDYSILFGPMFYLLQSEYSEFEELNNQDKLIFVEEYWENIKKNKNDSGGMLKEFYKRTLYVNKNFKFLSKDGWETDRGRIYMIYGSPDSIEHEFNNQGEFEIWMYKSNKKFIFLNKYGNYELYHQN